MSRWGYPETVLDVIDDSMRFDAAVMRAVRRFADLKPWTGSRAVRKSKFQALNRALAEAYGIVEPDLHFEQIDGGSSGGSHYIRGQHRIVLVGRLSVVTYLHEFAHARGMGERGACRWSINLFRQCFPSQYARLVGRGHMLIAPATITRGIGRAGRSEGK